MTAWNDFVKKIYHEGRAKNPNYTFKNSLKDASKRKHEMACSTNVIISKPIHKKISKTLKNKSKKTKSKKTKTKNSKTKKNKKPKRKHNKTK
jgi:hypothetical protein